MVKIVELFLKLLDNPLTDVFLSLGISENVAKTLSAAIITLFVWQAGIWLIRLQERFKNNKTARDLKPEFDYLTIKSYRDIFIPTRYARISPNRYDNPHEAHKHDEPRKLIPFMINKSFNERVKSEKFYLILADSGMGKTAFMVNLYMTYHSLFNFRKKLNQQMRLFRFQPPDINNPVDLIDRIKMIEDEDAKNMILLLDGLDEDPFILSKDPTISDEDAFESRLNDIVSNTIRFSDVVITCRTQYFPQQELQDYELNIRKPSGGFYKLNKYYLFPFSDGEVAKYLNKKYGRFKFWNWSKKEKAVKLIDNSHKLMSRPMLLSYLDDLVIDEKAYEFSHQIYETLIEKWLIRESEKWKKSAEQEAFRNNLRKLARETALHIYQNWQSNGVLYIGKKDALQIAQTHKIELSPDEVKGKSLLTCDPLLNWKFAHKSILEYFLAKECAENWQFAFQFNFTGMDMVKHFYGEVAPDFNPTHFVKVKGGTFLMGSLDNDKDAYDREKPQHKVIVSDFSIAKTPVTQKLWRKVMGSNPSHFKDCDDCPVESISWDDVQEFIDKLNAKIGVTFRLPTEAEWEYAAIGGHKALFEKGGGNIHNRKHKYAGSDNLDEVGWYRENSNNKTHPVAAKQPNELGIYDMSGNVREWCSDWFSENYYVECKQQEAMENPTGSPIGSNRVLRGGSWNFNAQLCRSAYRGNDPPGGRFSRIGFRLVFVP